MPLSNEIKHTSAAQQARFAALTPEQQTLEIWLNGCETNGHVAEAFKDIASVRGELAEALRLVREDVEAVRKEQRAVRAKLEDAADSARENQAIAKFIRRWGAWGTAAILFAVTVSDRLHLWDWVGR